MLIYHIAFVLPCSLFYLQCLGKAVGSGARIDIGMAVMRLAIAHGDADLLGRWVRKVAELVEKEGDWERRNKLNVYKAVHFIVTRDLASAATLLVDAVSTFTCTELMSFEHVVQLAVLTAVVHIDRVTLKEKVVSAPDVIQALGENPQLREYLLALYECRYRDFFKALLATAKVVRYEPGAIARPKLPGSGLTLPLPSPFPLFFFFPRLSATSTWRRTSSTTCARSASSRSTSSSRRTAQSPSAPWPASSASPRPLSMPSSPGSLPRAASTARSTQSTGSSS